MLKWKSLFLIVCSLMMNIHSARAIDKDYSFATLNLDPALVTHSEREKQFLDHLKKVLLSRRLNKSSRCCDGLHNYSFNPKWAVENGIPFIDRIEGEVGDRKYVIQLKRGLSYHIEGVVEEAQLSFLEVLLNRVDSKLVRPERGLHPAPLSGGEPPLPEGRGFPRLDEKLTLKVKPIDEAKVLNESINRVRSKLWSIIWDQHGGAVPGLKIDWLYLDYGQVPELEISGVSGEVDGKKFSLNFLTVAKGLFELTIINGETKSIYSFAETSDSQRHRVPGKESLSVSRESYCEEIPLNARPGVGKYRNCTWVMDDAHLNVVIQFMEKLFNQCEDLLFGGSQIERKV